MTISYKSGEKISLAGVPAAKINEIARNYVHANMDKIGATEANFKEALGIDSRLTGATLAERLASLEANRAYALKGKTAEQADAINKNYDLVLAYHGVRAEMVEKSKDSKPFTLPSINGKLHEASASADEGIEAAVPAGAWREKAHNAAEKHSKAERDAKRSDMAPIYAAIDDLPAGQQGAIRTILTRAHKEAKDMGVTGSDNILANMTQTLEGKDKGWFSKTEAETALDVIKNAQEIAAKRGNPDIFMKGSVLKQAAAAKAKAGKLDIDGKSVEQIIAMAGEEFVFNATPEEKDITAAIIKKHGSDIADPTKFGQLYVNLTQASQQEGASAGITHALVQLTRARDIFVCQKKGLKTIDALGSNDSMQFENYWNRISPSWSKEANDKGFMPQADFAAPTAAESVGAAAAAPGGASVSSKGKIKLWPLKDGTPAPKDDEVPALTDEAQVRALQEKLGVTVDGKYGPITHAAMLAAAEKDKKKPNQYDFTIEGALNAFFTFLTGGAAAPAPTPAAAAPAADTATAPNLKTQLASQLAAVAAISDTPLTLLQLGAQRTALEAKLKASGLTDDKIALLNQCGKIDYVAGKCTNTLVRGVEQALGLKDDGELDPKLIALINDPVSGPAIVKAINSGSITAVAAATGSGAPNAPGAGSSQGAGR